MNEGFSSDLINNMIAYGGIQATFSNMLGNLGFQILPSETGEVSNKFGTIPYISLESMVYGQSATAQTSPINIQSGQSSGQQNIQGQYTVQDGNGLTRMVMGYQPGGF